jgi:hypothetical protein
VIAQRIRLAVEAYLRQSQLYGGTNGTLDSCLDYVRRSLGRALDADMERTAEEIYDQETGS